MLSTQDKTRIDDTRIASVRPLMTPALLEERLPASPAHLALVERSRQDISNVLQGQDDRLVVVVGPCSIHDHEQALDYARRLKGQADALQQDLLVRTHQLGQTRRHPREGQQTPLLLQMATQGQQGGQRGGIKIPQQSMWTLFPGVATCRRTTHTLKWGISHAMFNPAFRCGIRC